MLEDNGARRQESLRRTPAMQAVTTITFPLKGVIQPNGVLTRDNPQNKAGITMVNVRLFGGYPDITNVPILAKKINRENGEEMTPDPGDVVVVQFINGNFREPVVMGFLALPENEIEASSDEAPPGKRRYHLRCNKTDVIIDQDGNRTTVVEGHETTTVKTGDLTITVSAGKCTVEIAGKTAWTSAGGIDLDGGSGTPMGVVQGACIETFTGKPYPDISSNVKASK